jgi:hypothetical protein
MNKTIFWDVMLCSVVEVYWRVRGTYCLHNQGRRIWQANKQPPRLTLLPWTLKMEAVCSSKTLVNFYQTTWHQNTIFFIVTEVLTSNLTWMFIIFRYTMLWFSMPWPITYILLLAHWTLKTSSLFYDGTMLSNLSTIPISDTVFIQPSVPPILLHTYKCSVLSFRDLLYCTFDLMSKTMCISGSWLFSLSDRQHSSMV